MGERHVSGLDDVHAVVPATVYDDDDPPGDVFVGATIDYWLSLWIESEAVPAREARPCVDHIEGAVSRVTGIVEPTWNGFFLVCGPARFHVDTHAYDSPDPAFPGRAALTTPPGGSWVTVEGVLSVDMYDDPWLHVGREGEFPDPTVLPASCLWEVLSVENWRTLSSLWGEQLTPMVRLRAAGPWLALD